MSHKRIAVTAVALVAAIVVAALFVLNGSNRPAHVHLVTAGRPSPAASPTGAASPSPAGVTQPVDQPAAGTVTGFGCTASTIAGAQPVPSALVSAVRTGSHPGYDRFVVEFSSVPGRTSITPQQHATFINSPKGDSVTLAGAAGLLVVIRGADAHTSFGGPVSFKPSGATLLEVRRVEDFEGYVGFGLGLAKSPCYRAFTLTSPYRLVIDVQAG